MTLLLTISDISITFEIIITHWITKIRPGELVQIVVVTGDKDLFRMV